LNRAAAEAAAAAGVRGGTDVTGFGLAGHASALARESALTLEIRLDELPLLPGALELAPRFQPGGLKANRRQFEPAVRYGPGAGAERRTIVFDPQTSGGLLLLVPEPALAGLLAALPAARVIGRALARQETPLLVV
jgi:selenide,water dikinase